MQISQIGRDLPAVVCNSFERKRVVQGFSRRPLEPNIRLDGNASGDEKRQSPQLSWIQFRRRVVDRKQETTFARSSFGQQHLRIVRLGDGGRRLVQGAVQSRNVRFDVAGKPIF